MTRAPWRLEAWWRGSSPNLELALERLVGRGTDGGGVRDEGRLVWWEFDERAPARVKLARMARKFPRVNARLRRSLGCSD